MVALVSVDRVKSALRIDHDDDDEILTDTYIPAASDRIIRHLKGRAEALLNLDSGGDLASGSEVPPEIEMATIMLVGYWHRNPNADPDKDFDGDELPGRSRRC